MVLDPKPDEQVRLSGRVYRGSSGNYWIHVSGDPTEYVLKLKGTLKKELVYSQSGSRAKKVTEAKKRRITDPVTVGDIVEFDAASKIIDAVQARKTELARTSPGSHEQHVLVANLDTLFIVVSAANPQPNLWMLDRFLVISENEDIFTQVVVNKMDLSENVEATKAIFAPYVKLGYHVHYTSAKQCLGIDELIEALRGGVGAFAGNSGVGKSSLLNAIQPGLTLKTGDIGLITHKGRHTTTQAELIPILDGETWIADTPGLRQLEFWGIVRDEIEHGFPEIRDHLGLCQYSNCTHRSEPGCAVTAAVERGEIDARRYRSYVQIFDETAV